jgi:ferredoxin-type protein NapH
VSRPILAQAAIAPAAHRRVPWTALRRSSQAAVLLLYLAVPLANARGLRPLLGNMASLRLGPVDLTEPAAALSALLASRGAGPLGLLLLGVALPLLLAAALGPVFCSWACPFGLLSELADGLRRRLPGGRGRRWSPGAADRAGRARWIALAALLLGSLLLGAPLAAILQGPRAVTAAAQEALYLGVASAAGAGLLAALLLADLLLPRRLFCRALCPAGAVLVPLRTPASLRVGFAAERCRCPVEAPCLHGCTWGVDPRLEGRTDGCTLCGDCVEHCPTGALAFTLLRPARRERGPEPQQPGGGSQAGPRLTPGSNANAAGTHQT